jgi:hypothetical protein
MILILIILLIIILNSNILVEGFNTCSEFYSNNLSILNTQPKAPPLKGYENSKINYDNYNKKK